MCIKYRLVIKGLPEDEAVLCTHDQTFSLRQVNTSNSLLLARKEEPTDDPNLHVIDDLSHTIEVIPCLARLTRIDELLQPTKYAGEAAEHRNANKVSNKKRKNPPISFYYCLSFF